MELGQRIKQLRYKASLTQEQLADILGLSPQAVSKWENSVAMPDITLLPQIAEVFGISIDDLFGLTSEQKLHRIERRMDMEDEIEGDIFREYEAFLNEQIAKGDDRQRCLSLLAHLYHHRLEACAKRISRYAREAISEAPEKKDCQWLLQKAEGSVVWDWNAGNHHAVIDFYKSVIENDPIEPKTPLPYYYLIDNLLADHRTQEAADCLEQLKTLPAHKPFLIPVYEAGIALAEYDEEKADGIMERAMQDYCDDGGFLFETAQYYARKCEYQSAIKYYELSYAADEENKPRYTDALQGIAMIYEILGDYQSAADTQRRILDALKNEWGFTEETVIADTEREIERLMKRTKE